MKNKKLVILSGFAKSGKTTLLRKLRKENWGVVSSSYILNLDTLSYFGLAETDENVEILDSKDDWEFYRKLNKRLNIQSRAFINDFDNFRTTSLCRDAKIHVAEKVIVPSFGRTYFLSECFDYLENERKDFNLVCTTIGDERKHLSDYLYRYADSDVVYVNIQSDDQENYCGYRTLIDGAKELFNTKEGVDKLYQDFLKLL